METGESAASNRDKQDREHHAGGTREASEDRSGHRSLAVNTQDNDAEDSAGDHDDHHDGSEVVARGLEHLDGHSASEDQVDHDDSEPLELGQINRELHTNGEHETMSTTPVTNSAAPVRLNFFWAQPKAIATKVNRMEMVPAQPAA